MSIRKKSILLLIGMAMGNILMAQTSRPPLSEGKWYKFSVTQDGIFKIDYNLLQKAGINPDQINPKNIQLFGAGNGMLPQKNSAPRNTLSELAISVEGEGDGKFNKEDYVLFFGQGPDNYQFNISKDIFWYENNLFSEKNFYFLTVASAPGKRLGKVENITGNFPVVTEFDDFGYYETDQYNELKSGRDWFGEQFDAKTEITVRFDFPGLLENSIIKMVSNVMAQSFNGSSFKVFFNDVQVAEQIVDIIPNTTYGIKGAELTDTITFNSSLVNAPGRTNQDIKYQYIKAASGKSIGYLDYFLFSFKRKLAMYGKQTIFLASKSITNPVSTFTLTSVDDNTVVWDVTDPFNTTNQSFTRSSTNLSFSTPTSILKKFIAFKSTDLLPTFESEVPNQNLSSISSPDLLIVTHPDLKSEAQRLANHRQTFSKLTVSVITTTQIYNQYSGGRQDIAAIRDFVRDLYNRSGSGLNNLLLFGRCSYDYKSRVLANTNLVPTYESRNSLSPLETYSSDDFFAFLEPEEGEWIENPSQNHTMDIGVGRLSVKTVTEAKDVVDKLIDYDLNEKSYSPWRKNILFIADDGDFNIHQGQADQLADKIDATHPELLIKKVYLDAFKQIEKPSGQISPETKQALDKVIKEGVAIVNFTGHGSEQVWMQERVLDDIMIREWRNAPYYPLFVTATCEFGRHDDPGQISSGEKVLLQKKGGGIGLVTTARPVNSSTNFTLNKAFYDALFMKSDGNYRDLGTVFRDTKNNSISGVANRNFSLLGDPSMKLTLSNREVKVTALKTLSNSDTLKALSRVNVKGEVHENGVRTDFSGELEATLYDKEENLSTLGDENPVFNYRLWNNALFRGKASVVNGNFEFDFVMPKNIDLQTGPGKLILYAGAKELKDAQGALLNFKIGKSEINPAIDTKAPVIQLFMGDTTYINGGLVGPNSTLVVFLEDENGITISKRDPKHNLTAILDDSLTFVLNDHYVSDRNNYSRGLALFPLTDMKKGKHTVTVGASDTYNNRSSATIDFVVTDGDQIFIDDFVNYPNPFSESTTWEFVHSRVGEDLEADLKIYDMAGQLMDSKQFSIPLSQYRVTLAPWDGKDYRGNKLGTGIYLAKLSVRSLLDGSKNDQFTKLIILN